MKITDVKMGINYCLNNAKRLLDDANLLFHNKGYRSSTPLCVFAYEEIGKAQFLLSRLLDNREVDEKEFVAFTNGRGAHMKKLMADYDDIRGILETMSDEQFEAVKKWAKDNGMQSWNCDRRTAIEIINTDSVIIDRLHDLKMAFLYTDYAFGNWISTLNYPNGTLAAIDQYIYWEVTRAYYKMKLNVFLFSIGVNTRHHPMTPAQQREMLTNEDCAKLNAAFEVTAHERFRKAKEVAIREIPVIAQKIADAAEARRAVMAASK